MKTSQKGFVSPALIIGIVVLVGIAGYFAMSQQAQPLVHVPNSASEPSLSSVLDSDSSAQQMTQEVSSTSPILTTPEITSPASTPKTPESAFINVPVRIHLLQSTHPEVQAIMTQDEVRAMFDGPDGVNKRYWNQYGINLKIESIVKSSVTDDSGYAQAIVTNSKVSPQQFGGLVPDQSSLLALDFVVVHNFGNNGGGLTLPRKGVMLVPESSIKGSGSKIMTFGFAHEFGHILLGGPHFSNSIDPYNIMAVGDPTVYIPFEKTHLTPEQITTAQVQAKKGTPNLTRAWE
ncbi:MAG: hypothetical protein M0P64_04475 [Candidatus Pacebacteria bacterium]|jgi:hypothetical protein|nr:hypothetical protein [Candidatus Paceibacterota bacterium]